LAQSINFPALATRFFNDIGTPLLATASSGLPITYSNGTTNLCQLLDLGSGKFSVQPFYPLTGADNVVCKLYASQPGNDKYAPALSVEQTLTFKKQATRIVYRTSAPTVSEVGTYLYASPTTTEGRIGGSSSLSQATSLTPTICTVDNFFLYDTVNPPRATVRAKANGTCSIKIDYLGNGDQLPSTATWTSVVAGLNIPAVGSNTAQTITFPAIADRNYGYSAPLRAVATSKLPVKYTSLTPSVCFVIEQLADGPSIQSAASTGADAATCTVQANQAGDDRYTVAAPVQISFNYIKAPMKLVHASAPAAMAAAGPYIFVTNVLYVETAMNSGLASLGHLLTVTSNTPAVCRVDSNDLWDRTGGIVNKTQVTALDNGTCQLSFYFPGTTTRASTSLTWSKVVTGFVIPTSTFIELQSSQKVVPSTGNVMSLKALDAGRVTLNALIKTPDPKLTGSTPSLNSLVSVSSLTPLVCVVERVTNTIGSSLPYTGSVIKPLKAGACTIRYSFGGNTSMKQGASSIEWNATVNA